MASTARKYAPTPNRPATSSLAGGDVAGTGLTVVEGKHWSEKLPTHRTASWNDGWVIAIPVAGIAVGFVARYGLWGHLLYVAAVMLTLVILVSLAAERVEKAQKRQRRLARAGR